MSVQRIASRYAKSLIDLAQERDILDNVTEDVKHFLEVCKVRDFALLLKSPIVHGSTKQSVFTRLFGEIYDPVMLAFLEVIFRKARERYLSEIAQEFINQYREIKEIASVSVTSANALGDEQLEQIRNMISASGATYKNVELSTKVDPTIIGGLIIEFDDKLYDASVARGLDEVRKVFS